MAGTWTVKIRVTNLAKRYADVTGTHTETVGEGEDAREVVWSQTLTKRRFEQDGKTVAQIRTEIDAELYALHEQAIATDAVEAQITNQEALMAAELNAMEAE